MIFLKADVAATRLPKNLFPCPNTGYNVTILMMHAYHYGKYMLVSFSLRIIELLQLNLIYYETEW